MLRIFEILMQDLRNIDDDVKDSGIVKLKGKITQK